MPLSVSAKATARNEANTEGATLGVTSSRLEQNIKGGTLCMHLLTCRCYLEPRFHGPTRHSNCLGDLRCKY